MDNNFLTKDRVKQILDNAPANLDKAQIIKGLVDRGYTLEGLSTPSPQSGKAERLEDIEQTLTGIKDVAMEGADQIQQAKERRLSGEQSLLETGFQQAGIGAKTVSRALIGEPIKGIAKIVAGGEQGEQKLKQGVSEVLSGASELVSRYESLKETNPTKAMAINVALGFTPQAVVTVKDMYEGYQGLKETNPRLANNLDAVLGFAELGLDISGAGIAGKTAVRGGKAGLEVAGEGAKAIGRGASKATGKVVGGVKKVTSEVIPSAERVVNYQVTRALDLTQGDVKNISRSTGNEVGQFMAEKNLIAGNKDETIDMVKTFYDTQYKQVRDEIAKVNKTYKQTEVPRYKQALMEIKSNVSDTPGLESSIKEIDSLLKKKTVILGDIQRTKELLDKHFTLYKATGDVREGVTKEGLANIRREIKSFIEKEVKDTTGTDIAKLNNEVATSRAILDLTDLRSTRGLTRSNIKIGDLGVFGIGSFVSPLGGLAAVAIKKILETPAVRLKIARYLDNISDARKLRIKKSLEEGKLPKEIIDLTQSPTLTPKAKSINTNKKKASMSKTLPLSKN